MDLKCAKLEVNRSARVDLISHLKPFLFQSCLEMLKLSTNCDIWNVTRLLPNYFKNYHKRKQFKEDGANPVIWT